MIAAVVAFVVPISDWSWGRGVQLFLYVGFVLAVQAGLLVYVIGLIAVAGTIFVNWWSRRKSSAGAPSFRAQRRTERAD